MARKWGQSRELRPSSEAGNATALAEKNAVDALPEQRLDIAAGTLSGKANSPTSNKEKTGSESTFLRGPQPGGFRFHRRCAFLMEVWRTQEPMLRATAEGHQVACHLTESA